MTKQFVPHDNQREALQFMHGLRRHGLWMPMGGGKTVTTLIELESPADFLLDRENNLLYVPEMLASRAVILKLSKP